MRKGLFAFVAILAIITVVWASGDPWKSKPVSEWTEKDIMDILQTSPWAKPGLQSQGAWRPSGMSQASGNAGIPGGSSDTSHTSAGVAPNQTGGLEKEDAAAAGNAIYSVFWWSSRTIRAASMRRAVLKGTMTEEDAEKAIAVTPDDMMILVQGTNMQIFQHRGEDAFLKAAYLQTKRNKEKIYPTKVSFLKGSDGESVTGAIFYFPRKLDNGEPTIAPDEKEVDFYLMIGEAKIITYFDPRKMVDAKGEDL
jgi:hypothetical protein